MFVLSGRLSGLVLAICALVLVAGPSGAQKVLDRYQVGRPALSHDGRLLAFDFYETAPDASRSTHRMLGIYDIEAETVRLHIAPPPRSFSTPSFSPDGQFLTMIQRCWDPSCSEDELGLNIGLLHLESGRFRLVTSGRTKLTHRGRESSLFTLRGYPVFSQTEPVIYFIYGSGPFAGPPHGYLPYVITQYTQGNEKLGRVDLIANGEEWDIDSLYGTKKYGSYGTLCCLSATNDGLIFKAWPSQTTDTGKKLSNKGIRIFHFDANIGRSEPLFANPPYFDGRQVWRQTGPEPTLEQLVPYSNFQPEYVASSSDGSRIIFKFDLVEPYSSNLITNQRSGLYVFDNEVFRKIFVPPYEEKDDTHIEELALSGDGRAAVIFNFNDADHFWQVDIDSDAWTSKPLRAPLHAATERRLP